MIDHIFSAICTRSSIDTDSNSVSLFNVLEQITIFSDQEIPDVLPISLEIFSDWARDEENLPGTGIMRVFFCDPNNECKQQAQVAIDLRQVIFFRTRVKSNTIEYKGPGRYTFLIELSQDNGASWEKVARLPLIIEEEPALQSKEA